MSDIDDARQLLARYLERGEAYEAELLLQRYGAATLQPVLNQLAVSGNTATRIATLELASEVGGIDNCRIVLNGLADPDDEIREIAASMLEICDDSSFADELLSTYQQHEALELRQNLALQIGSTANATHIPVVQQFFADAEDAVLRHNLDLALAKLGDRSAFERHVARLANGIAVMRFQALQDSIYIADRQLIAHFGPALDDSREYMAVTLPDEDPQIIARICDFAVTSMSALGAPLSFDAETVWRRTPQELDEAMALAEAARSGPAPRSEP